MRRTTLALSVALAAAAALSCSSTATSGSGPTTSGSGSASVPDFHVDDLDGHEFHMAEHVGESVILLNFWATWCEPCRVEMPHLDRLQQQYGDQGLRVLAVSMDGPDSVSDVRSRISRYDYAFTVLLDQDSEVTRLYNPRRAAPFNVLVDRSGSIAWTHEGYSPGDEIELEAQVRAALGLGEAGEAGSGS